ncbi:hypothetical protein M422DRAFT_264552 [Sphaerobolus stellatus SS14]|uniref:Amino acid permease/ SLC12A domain-containing protein n=1 Tax=Sphaerobolus stellatus (strain SS14) TaxID=990650 RepID=A0A0C9TT68_SPHS4|nr:hypothetical protein M422DRAFT_264552 [Sphaerobolus stellatus SS14]
MLSSRWTDSSPILNSLEVVAKGASQSKRRLSTSNHSTTDVRASSLLLHGPPAPPVCTPPRALCMVLLRLDKPLFLSTAGSHSQLGLLAYMGVSVTSTKVFNWFANMSSVTGMLNWFGICITLIRFRKGLKAQGLTTPMLWWSLAWMILIIADWGVFLSGNWDQASFVTNYLPIPVFAILYFEYKFWKKTKIAPFTEIDFVTFANAKQ